MKVKSFDIEGLKLFSPKIFGDERGYFYESFNQADYDEHIGYEVFVQDNVSKSRKGVLRGMHFQNTNPQGKLVRVMSGSVYDVAVDVRKGSPTFGQWEGVVLSDLNKDIFWIPPGFAHGFVVMSEEAIFEYKCTQFYHPASEVSLAWDDPDVNIDWGFDLMGKNFKVTLSEKDTNAKSLKEIFG